MSALRPRLHGFLQRRVREALAPREALLTPIAEALAAADSAMDALERRATADAQTLRALREEGQLWSRPFGLDFTIHQAWIRHAGASAVFARHHLPACHHCAVRFDETVGEAAAAYGIDPNALLDELNALLANR